ncbi:MAG: hypothetical protein IKL89_02170 [Clostridia bacterium]|nr:hypothetical protein [Clostridia bacterium]
MKILRMHTLRLVLRSGLFLLGLGLYIYDRNFFTGILRGEWGLLGLIWIFFVADMLLRFFPSRWESMGCQKQFAREYIPADRPEARPPTSNARIWLVFGVWMALNGAIAALYFLHIIDVGILVLVSLFYSVCDLICILFFCPFQSWMMENRCCVTCRIYNWDFAMMFTPLLLVPSFYSWSLCGLSLVLLLRWELTRLRHPRFFDERCNAALSCANCREHLCRHKRAIRALAKRTREEIDGVRERIGDVKDKIKQRIK